MENCLIVEHEINRKLPQSRIVQTPQLGHGVPQTFEMTNKNRTIYIDCTATFCTGLNTGIQRVVRNIFNHTEHCKQNLGFEVKPVVILRGRIYVCDLEISKQLIVSLYRVSNFVKSMLESARAHVRSHPTLSFMDYPLAALSQALRLGYRLYKRFRFYVKVAKEMERVSPRAGDCLVLLDSFWTTQSQHVLLKSASHIHKIVVVYDLIPIASPEFCEKSLVTVFQNAYREVFGTNCSFLTISKSVKRDVECYDAKLSPRTLIDYFYLGSDFVSANRPLHVRPDLAGIFDLKNIWLVVGSIEPRKNHKMVLAAFDRLWAAGSEQKLLIVGRIAWGSEELLQRILGHAEYGRRLFILNDISDDELNYCYSHASGLIFASQTEGFGLPLVEAMQRDVKVVCSDIAIFKEVGGQYPLYFDQNNADDMALKITMMANAKSAGPKNKETLLTWEQSTQMFFDKVKLLNERYDQLNRPEAQ